MNPDEIMGKMCRDRISGIQGICVLCVSWMFGCCHYYLKEVKPKKGEKKLITVVPEPALEVMSDEPGCDIEFHAEVTNESREAFGRSYTDIVTGFAGVCIGVACSIYDEVQLYLQPRCKKKNSKPKVEAFDKGRLRILEREPVVQSDEVTDKHKGGVNIRAQVY